MLMCWLFRQLSCCQYWRVILSGFFFWISLTAKVKWTHSLGKFSNGHVTNIDSSHPVGPAARIENTDPTPSRCLRIFEDWIPNAMTVPTYICLGTVATQVGLLWKRYWLWSCGEASWCRLCIHEHFKKVFRVLLFTSGHGAWKQWGIVSFLHLSNSLHLDWRYNTFLYL